ncbi:MAG: DEAD/DEAH box helicase family protein, partial [Proteobacteria bacterium]|nr:DEAD/DEAH box helicase family protein [Pseudomonadota bacterium]
MVSSLITYHVAIFQPPFHIFSYLHDGDLEEGVCVQVPFGRGTCLGAIVSYPERLFKLTAPPNQLKSISKVVSTTPLYSKNMMEFAYFLSNYYLHPLGDVLKSIQSYGAKDQSCWSFVVHPELDDHHPHQEIVTKIFLKRKQLRKQTFLKKLSSLCQEQNKNGAKLLRELLGSQAILEEFRPPKSKQIDDKMSPQKLSSVSGTDLLTQAKNNIHPLTVSQKKVFEQIKCDLFRGFHKPWLLFGVTGSGKTQIYLHTICDLLQRQKTAQVLLLVPEISLTPQMTEVVTKAFGGMV